MQKIEMAYRMSLTKNQDSRSAPNLTRVAAIVDGWNITLASQALALATLTADLAQNRGFILACMNLDHLVKLRKDSGLRSVYRNPRAHVMADGAPIAALARLKGYIVERSTGPDLIIPLCRRAAAKGWPIYLFGTRTDVLESGARKLKAECPGLDIRGIEAPPFGYDPLSSDADAASARMAQSGARIVLLGLGSPKQELFANRALARHPELGFVGIGAGLDFLTGEQVRAPLFLRENGLEWLWRLALNPRRLGLRYMKCAALLLELLLRKPPMTERQ